MRDFDVRSVFINQDMRIAGINEVSNVAAGRPTLCTNMFFSCRHARQYFSGGREVAVDSYFRTVVGIRCRGLRRCTKVT